MSKRLRTVIQYIIFLGLGMFLAWWTLKDLNSATRSHIKEALGTARFWLVGPVFIILFLSHYIRAIRWKLLMEPLGYKPSTTNTVFAVFIGYLANQAFPRLGEVLKCTVLARYEKIPADKLIGTIILERVIDAITLLIVFGITLAIQPDIYNKLINAIFHSDAGTANSDHISSSTVLLVVGGILLIVLIIWMIRNKKSGADVINLFRRIGRSIWQGISTVQHLKRRWLFIFLTIAMWSLYLAGGYLGFMAFRETTVYGINEAFTVLSAGSIGMVATPGGIGTYAFLIQKTMEVYGLNTGTALAFGWVLWVAQFAVILIGGVISFVAIPHYNKNKNQ